MKELKKYINESLLDDEDILIDNTKQTIDNPFACILISKQNNIPWIKFMDKMNEYVDDILDNFPSLKKTKYNFEFNSERAPYKEGRRIVWLEADIPNYDAVKKTIIYMSLGRDNTISVTFSRHWDFGAKLRNRINEKVYDKEVADFVKKYDLKRIGSFNSYTKQM